MRSRSKQEHLLRMFDLFPIAFRIALGMSEHGRRIDLARVVRCTDRHVAALALQFQLLHIASQLINVARVCVQLRSASSASSSRRCRSTHRATMTTTAATVHVVTVTVAMDCCMPAFVFDALERRLKKWRNIDLRLKRDRRSNDTQTFEIHYVQSDSTTTLSLIFSALEHARFPRVDEAAVLILQRCQIEFDPTEFNTAAETIDATAVDPQVLAQVGCCG
jgi:hypothetical protein